MFHSLGFTLGDMGNYMVSLSKLCQVCDVWKQLTVPCTLDYWEV